MICAVCTCALRAYMHFIFVSVSNFFSGQGTGNVKCKQFQDILNVSPSSDPFSRLDAEAAALCSLFEFFYGQIWKLQSGKNLEIMKSHVYKNPVELHHDSALFLGELLWRARKQFSCARKCDLCQAEVASPLTLLFRCAVQINTYIQGSVHIPMSTIVSSTNLTNVSPNVLLSYSPVITTHMDNELLVKTFPQRPLKCNITFKWWNRCHFCL